MRNGTTQRACGPAACRQTMKLAPAFRTWAGVLVIALLVVGATIWRQAKSVNSSQPYGVITLLIPDSADSNTPEVQIWTDAASERGILLQPQRVSDWMRGVNYAGAAAGSSIIVPDTFHRQMSDAAVQTIYRVVEAGGNAMVVQDGGILDERGSYTHGASRFSDLVGVQYGNYDLLKEHLSYYDEIRGAPTVMERLGIPPGRYLDAQAAAKLLSADHPDLGALNGPFTTLVAGYTRDSQRFAILKTNRAVRDGILLESTNGDIVASVQRHGKGTSVFVNLPLTYLMQRTDGIFLHGFLRFYAQEIVGQPTLMASPNGRGSLVLNWHNDDRNAISFLQTLQDAGIFAHGHQSMHFTAGPDVNTPGDGRGMDLDNNPDAQAMLSLLRDQGHTIGNHGGWIHNLFGDQASDQNGDEFVQYLDDNNDAVTRANKGEQPREYSAPMGNQPLWVFDWMAQHGVEAYYYSGNVGMPPTRVWMGTRRMGKAWAFPVLTYGQVASAEEASFQKMPLPEFDAWLQEVARFIEQQGVMRLSYFHPIGAVTYLPAVKNYIDAVQACTDRGRCQFISMSEAAEFLNRRENVQWALRHDADHDTLVASHPESLNTMTWKIPLARYTEVTVTSGKAHIERTETAWRVQAEEGKELTLQLRRQP